MVRSAKLFDRCAPVCLQAHPQACLPGRVDPVSRGMRYPLLCLSFVFTGMALASPDAPFTDSLSSGEQTEAGLDRLTEAERIRLNQLVALYQADRLDMAREEAALAASVVTARQVKEAQEAATLAAEAEMEARLAEEKELVAQEADREMEARVEVIREQATVEAVKEVEAQKEAEKRFVAVVEGTFRGWSGKTRFPLDNGQIWMQKQNASYSYNTKADDEAVVVIEKVSYDQYRLIYTKTGAHVPVTRIQ